MCVCVRECVRTCVGVSGMFSCLTRMSTKNSYCHLCENVFFSFPFNLEDVANLPGPTVLFEHEAQKMIE